MSKSAQVGIRASLLAGAVFAAGCNGPSHSPTAPGPSPGTTPSVTFYMLSGVVSQPTGDAVAGVRVEVGEKSATTDDAGRYTINDLSGPLKMKLSKEGYETQNAIAVMDRDRVMNVTLPATIRIPAGDAIIVTLYPKDPMYDFPYILEECSAPCKRIRVTVPGPGSLSVKLTAHDPARKLSVFTNEGFTSYDGSPQVTIPLGFAGAAEAVFYVTLVGGLPAGTDSRIDISTSFQPQ